jgi:Tfp pilus assembly protein PilX
MITLLFESRENMKSKLFQKKRGYVLPITIIAVVIIMLFSVTLLSIQSSEIRMRRATEDRVKVKYIAEAGLEATISAMTKSIQQGLNQNPSPITDIVVPINVNTSSINGQQYEVFKNKEKLGLDSVVFKVEKILNDDGTSRYEIKADQNTKSFEAYSLGKLYDTKGTLIRTYGASAAVTFDLDINNKVILSYDISKWGEER